MTIKQFMKKYGVPYNIVYNATYKVHPLDYALKEREYNEQELYREVEDSLLARIRKHKEESDRLIRYVKNMRGL